MNDVADLPAQSNSAVRYTEGMNKWFQQSLVNNRPWLDSLIAAGIKQAFTGGSPYMEDLSAEIGAFFAKDRQLRKKEIEAAVAETKRWVEGTIETKILPKFEVLEQRLVQHIKQSSERTDKLGEAITVESVERLKGIITGIEDVKRWTGTELEAALTALAERLTAASQAEQQTNSSNSQRLAAIDQRIKDLEREVEGRLGADALPEIKREIEEGLEALEQRLRAVPGKLPVAKTWHPETVVYQAEFVCHDGALWQASKDTATKPGGADWVCVAHAGRDGVDGRTPRICGTYDPGKKYQELDVVVLNGAAFVARQNNPGKCPDGGGWQLMSQQGRRGQRGERGFSGPQGPPAKMPKIVSTKIDENYSLVVRRSDDSLESFPLREAFERFLWETSGS